MNGVCNNSAAPAHWKARDGEGLLHVPVHGSGPALMRRPSALPLTNETYHTRRNDYSDVYHTRRETQCIAVRTSNAVPVH